MIRSWRRGVRAAVVSAVGAAALAPSIAHAQERADFLEAKHHRYESPQNFAVELRFSPFFYPDIDSDPSLHGCKPFHTVFGAGSSLLFGGEFDWQALRIPHLGTLGPGVAASVVSFSAQAPSTGPQLGGCDSNGSTSGESTTLNIYPLAALAVFRLDAFWKDLGVPLVPYAKLGPAFAYWNASNTLGTSTDRAGQSGQGVTWGSQLAIGVGFNLNFLDEYTARNFDESMGVNGTYVFAEWTDMNLDGLWVQSNPMRVGTTSTWTFGLAWEF
jgi:hypothetical protein